MKWSWRQEALRTNVVQSGFNNNKHFFFYLLGDHYYDLINFIRPFAEQNLFCTRVMFIFIEPFI